MALVDDTWKHRARARYRDKRQRAWVRVTAYCEVHADQHGHKPLTQGELRRVLGYSAQQVTRAINAAIVEAHLHPMSTARCLVLPDGQADAPCPASHRDGR